MTEKGGREVALFCFNPCLKPFQQYPDKPRKP
jgi:hypothetical protein